MNHPKKKTSRLQHLIKVFAVGVTITLISFPFILIICIGVYFFTSKDVNMEQSYIKERTVTKNEAISQLMSCNAYSIEQYYYPDVTDKSYLDISLRSLTDKGYDTMIVPVSSSNDIEDIKKASDEGSIISCNSPEDKPTWKADELQRRNFVF